MAKSKIEIVFYSVPLENEVLNFSESQLGLVLNEIFKQSRLASYQTAKPTEILNIYTMTIADTVDTSNVGARYRPINGIDTELPLSSLPVMDGPGTVTFEIISETPVVIYDIPSGHSIAWTYGSFQATGSTGLYNGFVSTNYKNAFNLDHNTSSIFTISSINGDSGTGIGSVIIEANYDNAVFAIISNTTDASINITNQSTVTPFTIDSITFTPKIGEESSRCNVNIATNHLATKLLQPFVTNPNTANPIIFSAYRAMTFTVEVEDADGLRANQVVRMPDYLNIDNFTLAINNSPNGATVIATAINVYGLDLQYSLNAIDWQTSNVFSGLAEGTYMFWVKDQLGAIVSKNFTVNEFGIYTPYFYISKSNSIRFANRITWGDAANYKNDENTLGAEVDVDVAYNGCQNFKTANIITTQFKSNYETNVAKVIKTDSSEVNIPIVKKTSNIGIKDKRDAMKYDLGNGKTGIYFTSGNIYNYDTNAIIEPHYMAGTLPVWAIIGSYINSATSWFTIDDIFYDEEKLADVIVISEAYTGADTAVIVGAIYNDFNYEVYEFTIDMANFINETIQVRINNDDDHFQSIEHLSEKIDVAVNFPKNIEINYWNDDNTDVFYATGIRHLINVELTKQEGVSEGESDTYKTDTSAFLLSAQLYEMDKFIFEPVSKEIWRKLMIALSHKNVFINGVQYVKNGEFESEGPLDKSNLYVLKATMLKTGVIFNSDSADGADFNSGSIEIPGLIETEIGFVKYI